MGAVGRGSYEARVRELLEHSDPVFSVMIEAMLEVQREIFATKDCIACFFRWFSTKLFAAV
jgi:hypothetical protein